MGKYGCFSQRICQGGEGGEEVVTGFGLILGVFARLSHVRKWELFHD